MEQEESSYAPASTEQGYEVEDYAPKVEEHEEQYQPYNPEPEYAPLQQQDRNSYGFPPPTTALPPPVPVAPIEEESDYLPRPPQRTQPSTIPTPFSSQNSVPPRSNPVAPPPPRQGVLSPPNTGSARVSPSYPRQMPPPITSPFASSSRSVISPRPPSRNQDGPILNHIQQRFVSPPPSHVNPYAPFPVPTAPPTQQQQSYIPANDPMLADLFDSSSARKSQPPAAYFTPDPPGRQQRSNSTSSQGSNVSMGGGYRPSSRGSQHQSQPPPHMFAQSQQQYNPQQYGGWGSQQPQDEMEELEDRYSPAGYGNYGQEPMRLRGGAYFSDSDSSDSEDEGDRVVMRLRGGATLDLGEMDEDEGNKSGDDWGFGDDVGIEEGGDEDAWGFGGDDDEPQPPTPSPPILRNPPPKPPSLPTSPIKSTFSNPTSPVRSSFAAPASPIRSTYTSPIRSNPSFVPSHAASTSISSVTSQTSTLSRPPSYSFTSSLAPPISTVNDLEPAEEEAEEGEDAWGFDEELEDESPPVESEPVSPPVQQPVEPELSSPIIQQQTAPLVEAELESPPTPEIVHEVRVDKVDVLPPVSFISKQTEEMEARAPDEPVESNEEVDEWGFGESPVESQETSPAQVETPLPEITEPTVEQPRVSEDISVEEGDEVIEVNPTKVLLFDLS